jgi:hypothetical protein
MATMHVLLGCKRLSCPARELAAVGTIWEANKLGGLNIKQKLQPRKGVREKSCSRDISADSFLTRGRPMTLRKNQAHALSGTAGVGAQACFGRAPEMATADRGYFSAKNERETQELIRVKKVALPARGRLSVARCAGVPAVKPPSAL